MNYIYSAMLLNESGKEISEANVTKVLEAAGEKPDKAKVKSLVSALEGVDISKEISKAAATPVATAPAEEKPKAEEATKKKEEKKEDTEKKSEEAAAGLGSLFG